MASSSAAPKIVHARWDDEAKVWWATSEDVPGLVAEERTYEALLKTVLELVPELLRLNGVWRIDQDPSIAVKYRAEHHTIYLFGKLNDTVNQRNI